MISYNIKKGKPVDDFKNMMTKIITLCRLSLGI